MTIVGKKMVPDEFVLFHRKIGMRVLTGIVLKTPVLTGRARGAWSVTLVDPSSTERKAKDKGGNKTISDGGKVMTLLKPYSVIYINNLLVYIEPLEKGHSAQAPNGMIAITLQEIATSQLGAS